jgi:hypothetical protein
MSSTLSMLLEQLTGDSLGPLSRQLGADRSSTQAAIGAALPLLFQGLARNASKPDGAALLHRALERDHDGNVLDDLGGFLRQPKTDDGNGILGHVLGDRRAPVEQGIAKSSGLDASKVTQLLTMVAPLVMGALGRQQRQGQLDQGGLADLLGREQRKATEAAPELGGLARLLDSDNDGSIADDLAGLGKGLLGSLLGGRR